MSTTPDEIEPGEVPESPTDPGEDPGVDPPLDDPFQAPPDPAGIPDAHPANSPPED